MLPLTLPSPTSATRSRLVSVNDSRQEALNRLYERREVVDNLIRSLEDYERAKAVRRGMCIEITAGRKCSSGFSQSRI